MVNRIYVEKRAGFDPATAKLASDLKTLIGKEVKGLRRLIRYDVEGIDAATLEKARVSIFSEPPVDITYDDDSTLIGKQTLVVEYLDGQYDQRADSAEQCVQILTAGVRPTVRCATVYAFDGLAEEDIDKVRKFLINPVDSKEGSEELPATLKRSVKEPGKMRVEIDGFVTMTEEEFDKYYSGFGFAMTIEDLRFVRDYFRKIGRNPTLTELKVIDTYWSDHCRHTTFLTEIKNVRIISDNPRIAESFELYRSIFDKQYAGRKDKYYCLMDIATLAAKALRKEGYLDNLDASEEINACSVVAEVDNDGKNEKWLIMFKNETHNHPTEIEPFGGAATCLGGAIRDPLAGRSYVYQAMRITGAGNPLESYSATLPGKLPQRTLTKTALAGFSSYGNQIGLATGIVHEVYNDRYKAKRLETGYVIGGTRADNVVRLAPEPGDVVLLVGGDTGRDGCGGATGSSKAHNVHSVDECGAEVQKGNPPEERKLQRLFRDPEAARMIKRCNDFGAGGVCVAIGELSAGLDIRLDKVSKKYEGLTATELAISESQERMAVVVDKKNAARFIELAAGENLKATVVAEITDTERLRMFYKDETIVDIERAFLDTNGVKQEQNVTVESGVSDYFDTLGEEVEKLVREGKTADALSLTLASLDCCSRKGAGETFDSTIGAGSVYMPFGGKTQLTPALIMGAKPHVTGFTHTVTCSSYGLYPGLMISSPFTGAIYAIVAAASKLVASGVGFDTIRLTLQEFFKRLNKDDKRWGEPFEALLGAFDAQYNLKLAAIGGKDSMSGTFENIDVPPTLIAFAMGIGRDDKLVTNVFPAEGYIYRFKVRRDEYGRPDYEALKNSYALIEKLIDAGEVAASAVVEEGGFAVALARSLMGDMHGAVLERPLTRDDFTPAIGDVILVTRDRIDTPLAELKGVLSAEAVVREGSRLISVKELVSAYVSTLEGVFPTTAGAAGEAENASFLSGKTFAPSGFGKPRVFIPVFPGTNCEYDTAGAFERAGGIPEIFVVKNRSAQDIEQSISAMRKLLDASEIIAFPGGFSGGDEPDGSGKFIATAFRNPALKEGVETLLYKRDGLALGICNGFQALIKLGLLPFGRIEPQTPSSATLTFNNIARHVSSIVEVRVATDASPWLTGVKPGEVYKVPVSHGEGKFVCDVNTLATLVKNGQIATQYADPFGNATMLSPFNPNGSVGAVEGIISPDGRIFGKMGHAERWREGLYLNVKGDYDMKIFASGVKYFL